MMMEEELGKWGEGETYTACRDSSSFLCAFCFLSCDGGDADGDEGDEELHFDG